MDKYKNQKELIKYAIERQEVILNRSKEILDSYYELLNYVEREDEHIEKHEYYDFFFNCDIRSFYSILSKAESMDSLSVSDKIDKIKKPL